MKYKRHNLNWNVKVKPTEHGFELLAKYHNEFIEKIESSGVENHSFERHNPEHYKSMVDDDGYLTFQMWDFIEKLGGDIGMWIKNPIYLNVLIQVE